MSWNYRVIYHPKTRIGVKKIVQEEFWAIHEAYYNEDGAIESITMDPIIAGDETEESLKNVFKMLRRAFTKPPLYYNNF